MSRLFRNISEFSKTKKSCQTFLYVTLLQRLRSVNISMFLDEIDGVYCFYHSLPFSVIFGLSAVDSFYCLAVFQDVHHWSKFNARTCNILFSCNFEL